MYISRQKLKDSLKKPLPGSHAFKRLAPAYRLDQLANEMPVPADAKKSAVMILFFHQDLKLKVICIRRSNYVGIHAGQIAFPGGRFEAEDITVEHTALRETYEEIGIASDKIELLGRLSDIYVPPSNFLISVFVGFLNEQPGFKPDYSEVAEIIEIDFEELLHPNAIQMGNFFVPSVNHTIEAPCYSTSTCQIWGATAMVMSELIEIITDDSIKTQ